MSLLLSTASRYTGRQFRDTSKQRAYDSLIEPPGMQSISAEEVHRVKQTVYFSKLLPGLLGVLLLSNLSPPNHVLLAQEPHVQLEGETKLEAETRQEKLRRLRLLKREDLQRYEPRFWESYFYQFDQKGNETLADSNFYGLYPRLEWVGRGSGPAAGFRYWRPAAWAGLDVMGSAFYSWNQYQYYDLHFGQIPNLGKRIPPSTFQEEDVGDLGDFDPSRISKLSLYGSFRYRLQAGIPYFGSGSDTVEEDRTSYLHKDTRVQVAAGYRIAPRLAFTVRTGILQNSLGTGRNTDYPTLADRFDAASAPGLSAPPHYHTVAATFSFDERDHPQIPGKGYFVAAGWELFSEIGGQDRFSFAQYTVDGRAYIPLGSDQRVLALRALTSYANAAKGDRVPFFLQPSLGGSRTLRGFESDRFRGDKAVLLQAEYRWHASRRVELALFGDGGAVADPGMRLSSARFHTDVGFGFRIKTARSTLLRIDTARSNEGFRVLFRFGGVF